MSEISKKLGKNIRALRRAYGDTQESLAQKINSTKTGISEFESGKNQSYTNLEELSKYYSITSIALLYKDYSDTETSDVDYIEYFFKTPKLYSRLLPIITSQEAMLNEDFAKAYRIHKRLLSVLDNVNKSDLENINPISDNITKGDSDIVYDSIQEIIDGYQNAYCDSNAEAESAANFLGIFTVIASCWQSQLQIKKGTADFDFIKKNYPQLYSFLISVYQILSVDSGTDEIDSDLTDMLFTYLSSLRESSQYSELAYYYLALLYMLGISDNDLPIEYNQQIGSELMRSLIRMKNPYAERLIDA